MSETYFRAYVRVCVRVCLCACVCACVKVKVKVKEDQVSNLLFECSSLTITLFLYIEFMSIQSKALSYTFSMSGKKFCKTSQQIEPFSEERNC